MKSLLILSDGRAHTFWYRAGTADETVVANVFGKGGAFDLRTLGRIDEIRACYRAIVDAGRRPLIIDAGAHIGAVSVFFAVMWPEALVVAIEPEPGNLEVLRRNAEGLGIEVWPNVLAGTAWHYEVYDPGQGTWGYRTRACERHRCEVGSVGIHGVMACQEMAAPFLVKIDIVGAEVDVFGADVAWLDCTPVLMVEPHDWMLPGQGTSISLLRALAGRARDFIIKGEHVVSIAHDLECWR